MAVEDVGLKARIQGVNQYLQDARSVQRETDKIGKSVTSAAVEARSASASLLGALKPIAAGIAGAFAVQKIATGVRDSILAASDLNETVNKVDAVFGEAAGAVKEFGDSAAQSIGVSENAALSAAGTFGNLFTTMGLGKKESADMSLGLLKIGADLGSFNNIDPTEVLDKLRSGLVGETEPVRQFGIDLSEATVKQEALALGIAAAGDELTQAQKVQARYSLILKQSANATGDFAKTSGGLANASRIINASFADLQAEIGGQLLPAIAPLVAGFSRSLPDAFKAAKPVIEAIGGAFRTAVNAATDLVNRLAPIGKAFSSVVGELGSVARTVGPAIGDAFRDISAIVEGAVNTVADVALPTLQGLWDQIVAGWESIAPLIQPALDSIAGTVNGVLSVVRELWDSYGADILAIIHETWDGLAGIVGAALDVVISTIRGVLKVISGDWQGAWDEIERIHEVVWDAIVKTVQRIGQILYRQVQILVKALRLESAWYDLRDFVLSVWSGLVNGIKGQLNALIPSVNSVIDTINDALRFFGQQTIEFNLQPLDIEEFIPPPRPGWFGDVANEDLELLNTNIAEARQNTASWFATWIQGGTTPSQSLDATANSAARARAELGSLGSAANAGTAGAKAAVKGLQDDIKQLESDIRSAQQAMAFFSDPRLVGMQAAEDELFDLDQQIKRARLAELELGKAGKTAAKDVADATQDMGDGFDVLSAQQTELAQGIPVPFQRAMDEAEKAKRAAEQIEIQAPSVTAAADEGETEVERLQRLREIAELKMQLDFDPQKRALRELFEELTGANKEMTFEEARAGLAASAQAAGEMQARLTDQKALLEAQQAVLEASEIVRQAALRTETAIRDTQVAQRDVLDEIDLSLLTVSGRDDAILRSKTEQVDMVKEHLALLDSYNEVTADVLTSQDEVLSRYQRQSEELAYQRDMLKEMATLEAQAAAAGAPQANRARATPLAEGGNVTAGGWATVGERGTETLLLPRGSTVLPHAALQQASVSKSWHDEFNITQASSPVDVMNEIRKFTSFERIRGGRR